VRSLRFRVAAVALTVGVVGALASMESSGQPWTAPSAEDGRPEFSGAAVGAPPTQRSIVGFPFTSPPEVDPTVPTGSRSARAASIWTCGPGPERVSDLNFTPERYFKAQPLNAPARHEFYFARAMYTDMRSGFFGGGRDFLGDGGPTWSIDYPLADRIMTRVATRLSNLDACEWEFPVSLADPDLRHFPFLYSLEWGAASLTDAEVDGLRGYLAAGGFLMIDDFWGSREWANFEREIGRVLPGRAILDVPSDHLLFRIYYDLDGRVIQVPNAGNGRAIAMGQPGARTSEQDGFQAHLRGIFDDNGRLMVAINWNTDLGDALEWAESPFYPLEYSTFASRIFMNTIMYAMTY